jgi:formate hydrogenlyase subunit 4
MSGLVSGLVYLVAAPLLGGLLAGADRVVTARMQGRIGPPLLQPFFDVGKLLQKEVRTVNGLAEPMLVGHLASMALAGALLVGGADLLLATFVFALSSLLLALAAGSADSPFGSVGAERELVALLAAEPLLILLAALVCRTAGANTLPGVLASPVKVALELPGVLAAFLVIVTIKLRKSPFDLSASHHAHQELVRGLTADMSARLLAWVELAHWYETVLLGLFVILFFNWSVPLGIAAALVALFLEILVDNASSRVTWQLMLRSAWVATLVLAGGNALVLSLWRW